MCQDRQAIAICACGAKFAGCDTVEALCHITARSSRAHHWIYIYTGVFEAGRVLNPSAPNPTDYREYLRIKGRM
jgi:hypothetical protein